MSTKQKKNVQPKVQKTNLALNNLKKFMRNRMAVIGLIIVFTMIFMCVFAPLFTSYDPMGASLKERGDGPSEAHLLGCDKLGRDVFCRILYGGRYSILIGLMGSLGSCIVGVILGCIAGYFGGWIDTVLMKFAEVIQSIPSMMLCLVLATFMTVSVPTLALIFALTGWTGYFRMVRGRFFSLREEPFVEACKAFGLSNVSIMFKHILPNSLGPVTVQVSLAAAGYILSEAGLSYLGVGVPASVPTWGNILNGARDVATIGKMPWLWLAPGCTISLFTIGVNFMGDGLRDALDPKQ